MIRVFVYIKICLPKAGEFLRDRKEKKSPSLQHCGFPGSRLVEMQQNEPAHVDRQREGPRAAAINTEGVIYYS